MTDILHRIRAYKGDEIVTAKRSRPQASLERTRPGRGYASWVPGGD